jgi:hypothetical protein
MLDTVSAIASHMVQAPECLPRMVLPWPRVKQQGGVLRAQLAG